MTDIHEITDADEKSAVCAEILRALPQWFGNAEANAGFIRGVRRMPFFAAMENGAAIGFAALDLLDDHTAEIHVMGVLPAYHRQGAGRRLFARCEEYCLSRSLSVMTVKTLAGTHPSGSYAKTRKFYEALGFLPEKITAEWGEEQPCLHMRRLLTLRHAAPENLARLFPVILHEYNPAWPAWFLEEKAALERLLGPQNIVRVLHCGSTAIPGMAAKPTIDILLEIPKSTDMEAFVAAFPPEYILLHPPTTPTPPPHLTVIKGYLPTGFAEKVYHIHVRYPGDHDELRFRDYLVAHPETAQEYAALKSRLRAEYTNDRDGYTNAKGDFVRDIMEKARQEAVELWDVYDGERRKTGRLHRRGIPMAQGDYHVAVHIWIQNSRGEWLIDRRSPDKDFLPNMWETTGGSALAGESSLEAALREVREELGIVLLPKNGRLWRTLRRESPLGLFLNDFCDIWLFEQEVALGDITFQPGETCDARWAAAAEIRAMMRAGTYFNTPYFEELAARVEIRRERPEDYNEVRALVQAAFETAKHGDGTEADYLDELRIKDTFIPELSFVALADEKIVGQIVLYQTKIATPEGERTELLLSPLSVHPAYFRRGIARALVEHALAKAKQMGYRAVFLCGDPAIYTKLGFVPSYQYGIFHKRDPSAEWSMVRALYEGALGGLEGEVETV